jgi:NAD(P)-dependent dehydrogenase (short-subunit alcohol dehydrogenase family)
MGALEGRRALVTGAATGIGAATVRRFEAEGADVLGVDVAPGFDGFTADVTDPEQMAAAVRAAGELDVCVANAGVSLMEPFVEGTVESWTRVIAVNLLGVMVTLQAAARAMPDGGRLLATSSIAGLHGEASAAAYCASKAGVVALVRTLAIELGPDITVAAVAPGQIETSMSLGDLDEVAERVGRPAEELLRDHLERRVPAHRMGTPDEIAAVFAFLASDEARFINGEVVRVDGGELAG